MPGVTYSLVDIQVFQTSCYVTITNNTTWIKVPYQAGRQDNSVNVVTKTWAVRLGDGIV